jgi:hypothetical protein
MIFECEPFFPWTHRYLSGMLKPSQTDILSLEQLNLALIWYDFHNLPVVLFSINPPVVLFSGTMLTSLTFSQILTGHQENAEFALAMCPAEPYVLSGG